MPAPAGLFETPSRRGCHRVGACQTFGTVRHADDGSATGRSRLGAVSRRGALARRLRMERTRQFGDQQRSPGGVMRKNWFARSTKFGVALVEDCKATPTETLWQKLKKHL